MNNLFISDALKANIKDHLEIGGVDSLDLASIYGTPLYVMNEEVIRKNCRVYKNALDKYYDGFGLILYASKAFSCKAICKIVDEEGLGVDVVSGGELYTAKSSGFPMDKVYFHGNNKTKEELELAIDNNIKRIIVDNKEELFNINEISKLKGKISNISFRIKPGIDAHTHNFIKTGQIDSKFGLALENNEAYGVLKIASTLENVKVVGLHCHIGSQIFDLPPFELAAKVMLEFITQVKKDLGIEIQELNLGGGFGIRYTTSDDPIEFDHYIESISKVVKETCSKNNIKLPYIVMEPGRSIVGESGVTIYTVGSVKNIPGVRTYVSVDGGMTDNPRYALYAAKYSAVLANRVNDEKTEVVTIAGKCCESGDILIKDIKMPKINSKDYIAIFTTGAYNYSMASNYNRIPRPPVVLASNGKHKLIIKRETYDDIIKNDLDY